MRDRLHDRVHPPRLSDSAKSASILVVAMLPILALAILAVLLGWTPSP